jgi:glycosyltransferase involved in cell wall biosynthesis
MAYEPRDFQFLQAIDGALKPIAIGPSWFVDQRVFEPSPALDHARDIDIIIVAAWAGFKRHDQLFRGIAQAHRQRALSRVALVGYPSDLNAKDIEQIAIAHGIDQVIEIHEWLEQGQVADLYRRARMSVLWSRFEGDNRSIVESMLCDTPVIVRDGHNYGVKHRHINPQTGLYATEAELPQTIVSVLDEKHTFRPRAYVLREHSCQLATAQLGKKIREVELAEGKEWTTDLVVKTNYLHGMHYWHAQDEGRFALDYAFLLENRRNQQSALAPSDRSSTD